MKGSRLTGILDRALGWALAALMLGLVASVTWQVTSRYLLGDPSPWTEELARYLLVWIGLLGGAHAYRTGAHMGIDLIAQQVGWQGRIRLRLVSAIAVLAFALPVMVIGGASLVNMSWELGQRSAAMALPMGAVYTAIPLSGLLISWYALREIAGSRGDGP